jgi:extradiol ring-cleavage dioxygenase class III protein subunit B
LVYLGFARERFGKAEQVYDMYGIPDELYQIKYEPAGSPEVAKRLEELVGDALKVDNTWGIDHGTWTVLHHMFPKADILVLQLSINGYLSPEEHYALGQKLNVLRNEGVLIIGSGNTVHNLWRIERANASGTPMAFA